MKRRNRPPNRGRHEEQLEELMSQIRPLEERLKSLGTDQLTDTSGKNNGILEQMNSDLKRLRDEKEAAITKRKAMDQELRVLNDKISKMSDSLSKLGAGLKFKTQNNIDGAIRKLDHQLQTRHLKFTEENRIVREIDSLRRSKKRVKEYQENKKEMDDERMKEMKLKSERDKYFFLVSSTKKKEDSVKHQIQQLRSNENEAWNRYRTSGPEREALKKEIDSLYEQRRQRIAEFRQQQNEYHEQLKLYRAETARKKEVEKKAMVEAKQKAWDAYEASLEPYEEKRHTCSALIKYLQNFQAEQLEGLSPGVSPGVSPIPSPSCPNPPSSLVEGKKEFTVLKKKDDEDVFLPHTAVIKRRKSGRRNRKASWMNKPMRHSAQIFSQFSSIGLTAPTTPADLPEVLEQLYAKKSKKSREQEQSKNEPQEKSVPKLNTKLSALKISAAQSLQAKKNTDPPPPPPPQSESQCELALPPHTEPMGEGGSSSSAIDCTLPDTPLSDISAPFDNNSADGLDSGIDETRGIPEKGILNEADELSDKEHIIDNDTCEGDTLANNPVIESTSREEVNYTHNAKQDTLSVGEDVTEETSAKELIVGYSKRQSTILDHRSQIILVPHTNVRLEIPEGAIRVGDEVDVTITVHLDEHNQPPLRNKDIVIGPSVCIQPHGTVFLKPVTVTIPHSAGNITSKNITVWTKTSEVANQWDILFNGADKTDRDDKSNVHVTERTIKIRVTHFSWIATLLSYLTGSQQTLQMEMIPFMNRPQVKETDVIYLRVYVLREDQTKFLKDEEDKVNGAQCGEMTPFALYVNGANISCRIRMIEQENKWRMEEDQKELLYEQIQQGKYVKCTFAFKKLDVNVQLIHGLISGNQTERRLFIDSTFGTMCIGQKQDKHEVQPHPAMSRLHLQAGQDQAAGPPESLATHQSTHGYHMPSTSADSSVHQEREMYDGMSRLQLQRRDASNPQQPRMRARMYEMSTSSPPDSLAYRRYELSASGYNAPSESIAQRAGPMSLHSSTVRQRNTASAAASTKQASSLHVRGVDEKPTALDLQSVAVSSQYVSNDPLFQSLQPFKPKQRGSLINPFLEMVARGIQLQWRDLAARLGFSDDDCDEFNSGDNAPGPYWPAFRMLDRFRETISDREALNGRAILADTIKTLNTNLYERIVEMV